MTRTRYDIVLSLSALLLCLLFFPAAAAESSTAGDEDDLERLVVLALANNPAIDASEERWRMAVHRVAQAGVLPDPMLMLQLQNGLVRDPLDLNRDPGTATVIGLSQTVPFFGKRGLQRQGAERAAEVERWQVEERRIALRRMVKETWYRIYAVDRGLDVVVKNIAALDDLVRFSETMYGVGQGLQQDVLKAQLQRSKMEEMRIDLQQRRRSLAAALNSLLYRPVEASLPAPPLLAIKAVAVTQAELEQLADAHRPALKALTAQVDKADISRALADKEFLPDFTLSLEYMLLEEAMGSEGDDMYTASVSFNLPVQRARRRAMVAEAGAEGRMVLAEREVLRNRIRQGVADGLAALDRNRRLAELYDQGLIPQATAALEVSLAAYRVGRTDFMTVLDSRMALFNLEREYHDAVAEHRTQLAVLEGLVGTPLPRDGQ
ncbi:TolC family protein [Desulfoprunum benzoelyticum]|uniref:Outer membrane protein TolC n=1 Tax=Desulfoprunum benzoelyticum TaxID=1506996 RepID=A0A840UXL3_9BACT|nr:TolC family protein [Desulfoprunum benzoelyticum]MBB5347418.1 outer membrane protein TolC [Desulfoprunum benzoelyticum]MBM9529702.1 TolC family protein [Desulfoprunum benzoelyticum]